MFSKHNLKYFSAAEFGEYADQLAPSLLTSLDKFRELWGAPVLISPVDGAIGRHLGHDNLSQHNIDRWGEVRAVDVFPEGLNSLTAKRAYECAKKAGFTGIGLYSDTRPSWMMHLDVRDGKLATWSRVAGNYLGINELIA
ncbi:MAG: hypothetical protein ACPGMR_11470 [Pontibacterium sp.]